VDDGAALVAGGAVGGLEGHLLAGLGLRELLGDGLVGGLGHGEADDRDRPIRVGGLGGAAGGEGGGRRQQQRGRGDGSQAKGHEDPLGRSRAVAGFGGTLDGVRLETHSSSYSGPYKSTIKKEGCPGCVSGPTTGRRITEPSHRVVWWGDGLDDHLHAH